MNREQTDKPAPAVERRQNAVKVGQKTDAEPPAGRHSKPQDERKHKRRLIMPTAHTKPACKACKGFELTLLMTLARPYNGKHREPTPGGQNRP